MERYFAREEPEFSEESDYEEERSGDEFKEEAKAFERVGVGGGALFEAVEGIDPHSREDKLFITIDAISRSIKGLTQNDIENIINKARDSENVKYKNPVGLILGYIASQGGQYIIKRDNVYTLRKKDECIKNFRKTIEILDTLPEKFGVFPLDIIRYARFWAQ